MSWAQKRVLRDLGRCRTAALGGHVERCDHCAHERISYNSCRNRHCPKCHGVQTAAWLEREAKNLLPVPYYHVVFTLPQPLRPVALQNPRVVYNLLFQAASETLQEAAANPRHLGARLGVLMTLHTWGQQLESHPHVHCVVPGGGLACDAKGNLTAEPCWRSCRPGFFLPHNNEQRTLTLDADEFLRRFLLHVLPKRFVKTRHYGLLANRGRDERLECCRRLLFIINAAAQLAE